MLAKFDWFFSLPFFCFCFLFLFFIWLFSRKIMVNRWNHFIINIIISKYCEIKCRLKVDWIIFNSYFAKLFGDNHHHHKSDDCSFRFFFRHQFHWKTDKRSEKQSTILLQTVCLIRFNYHFFLGGGSIIQFQYPFIVIVFLFGCLSMLLI